MTRPRLIPSFFLAASAAMLGAAYLFEHVGGLEPCSLCLYQRTPYMAAIALSGLLILVARSSAARAVFLSLLGALFLAGLGLALYHVGVQQGLFEGPGTCAADYGPANDIEALRERLLSAPIVRCDQVLWSFLGLSMPAWNAVVSGLLAAGAIAAALRPRGLGKRT